MTLDDAPRRLIAFLRARLDEEAVRANGAGGSGAQGQWRYLADFDLADGDGAIVAHFHESWLGQIRLRHVASHDPQRALRAVEAMRELVLMYENAADDAEYDPVTQWMRAVAEALAGIWIDHPDYTAAVAG